MKTYQEFLIEAKQDLQEAMKLPSISLTQYLLL